MFYIYNPEQRVDIRMAIFPAWIAKTQSEKSHSASRLYNKPVRLSDNEITTSVNQKFQEHAHVESRENIKVKVYYKLRFFHLVRSSLVI